MSIRFHCERCGHSVDVDRQLAGAHGKCKHCGHVMTVPEQSEAPAESPVRLRPLEADEPAWEARLLHAGHAAPELRAAEAEPLVKIEVISAPPTIGPGGRRDGDGVADYHVLSPETGAAVAQPASPVPWTVVFLQFARFVSGRLLALRNWLYVVSLVFLVFALYGYVFKITSLLHLGGIGVVATNIGMLIVGIFYLVSLPFKEGPQYGFLNLLLPFYAFYYWATRWQRMKGPVFKTLSSFMPIFLVGLAYLIYKEGPVVEKAVEDEVPIVERKLDEALPKLEREIEDKLPLPKVGGSAEAQAPAAQAEPEPPAPPPKARAGPRFRQSRPRPNFPPDPGESLR